MAAAADVIYLPDARRPNEFGERFDQIEAVYVVANLFTLVAEHAVRPPAHCADHQVRKKTVQFRAGMRRAGETSTTKRNSRHSEITSIFLHQKIGGSFGCAEERVLAMIDTHRFGNPLLVFMSRLNFPSLGQFTQWQSIWRVAIDFVC